MPLVKLVPAAGQGHRRRLVKLFPTVLILSAACSLRMRAAMWCLLEVTLY
jgi:hypothetical protein